MTIEEIIEKFPDQINSHLPFIVEFIPESNESSYTIRIAQNIKDEIFEIFNSANPFVQTYLHFAVKRSVINNLDLYEGKILENFDLSVWDSTEPQYLKQKPRTFKTGLFEGENMLHNGIPYYRHVKLVTGKGRRDLWYPDQLKFGNSSLQQEKHEKHREL